MKKTISCFLTALICGILLYACEKQPVYEQTAQVANNDTALSETGSPEPEIVSQTNGSTVSSSEALSNPDFSEWKTSEWPTINQTTDELPILFALNGFYGYMDSEMRIIVPPIYDQGFDYNDQGYTWVRYEGIRNRFECMVLNWKGKAVFHEITAGLNILYDDIICYVPFGKKLRRVERFRNGTVIIDGLGSGASSSEDGILLINDGSERYFMDLSGNKILPDLDMVRLTYGFREGRAVITAIIDDSRDMHIIDVNGKFYDKLNLFRAGSYFSEGLLPAETKERVTGYINRDGEFVFTVPIVAEYYDDDWSPLLATDFKGGYALIQTSLEPPVWRVINNMGDFVSDELSIFQASAFADGLSCIRTTGTIDRKYGYINTKGETVIEPVFDDANSFVRGYARIVYEGRDGLINTEGEIFWCDEFVRAE
jgi:hypothetical protein